MQDGTKNENFVHLNENFTGLFILLIVKYKLNNSLEYIFIYNSIITLLYENIQSLLDSLGF